MSCETTDPISVGDKVRVTGTFKTAAAVVVDPATVTFKFKDPNGVITTYLYMTDAQVVRLSEGIYIVDVSVTLAGTWHMRWSSTGTGQAADEDSFEVEESEF